MKYPLLIAVITIGLLSGCSTSNISTQTPDDVYYSPAKGSVGSRVVQKQQDEYENYMSSNDDQYLAMKVHNYNLWSPLDDYSYWYDSRYSYSNYNIYASSWYSNPYSYNSFNPYYGNYYYGGYNNWAEWNNPGYVVACYKNIKVAANTYTSGSNISAYHNRTYNTSNYPNIASKNYQSSGNNSNTNSFGNIIRRAFTPSTPSYSTPGQARGVNNSTNTQTYTNPVRVYTPTSTPATTSAPSSSAGGASGGYNSSGSSSSGGRSSRN